MILVGIIFVAAIGYCVSVANALEPISLGRRELLRQGSVTIAAGVAFSTKLPPAFAQEECDEDALRRFFRSVPSSKKKGELPLLVTEWTPTSRDFSQLRYSTSSLSSKESIIPEPTCKHLPYLPSWMEGHWLTTYKFDGASFPNGRDKISLALPGAGLGTCAVLPNVGANPAPFVQRFQNSGSDIETFIVEDAAYNLPRKFEGFWPAAKVNSVRVSTSSKTIEMGPSCLVTGEGCSLEENPGLHGRYATRCQIEFEGPTRRGGFRTQHFDLSMVDSISTTASPSTERDNEFLMARSFVQYNQEQELTSYYRELVSYEEEGNGTIKGRTTVAAFLPSSTQAIALYNYMTTMKTITEEEAATY